MTATFSWVAHSGETMQLTLHGMNSEFTTVLSQLSKLLLITLQDLTEIHRLLLQPIQTISTNMLMEQQIQVMEPQSLVQLLVFLVVVYNSLETVKDLVSQASLFLQWRAHQKASLPHLITNYSIALVQTTQLTDSHSTTEMRQLAIKVRPKREWLVVQVLLKTFLSRLILGETTMPSKVLISPDLLMAKTQVSLLSPMELSLKTDLERPEAWKFAGILQRVPLSTQLDSPLTPTSQTWTQAHSLVMTDTILSFLLVWVELIRTSSLIILLSLQVSLPQLLFQLQLLTTTLRDKKVIQQLIKDLTDLLQTSIVAIKSLLEVQVRLKVQLQEQVQTSKVASLIFLESALKALLMTLKVRTAILQPLGSSLVTLMVTSSFSVKPIKVSTMVSVMAVSFTRLTGVQILTVQQDLALTNGFTLHSFMTEPLTSVQFTSMVQLIGPVRKTNLKVEVI